jgi:hypothetical protein
VKRECGTVLIVNLMKIHYSLLKAGLTFEVSTSSSIHSCSFIMAVGQYPCRLSVSNMSTRFHMKSFYWQGCHPTPCRAVGVSLCLETCILACQTRMVLLVATLCRYSRKVISAWEPAHHIKVDTPM